jgi:uncharacterized protein YbjQ (UPF0145 family)
MDERRRVQALARAKRRARAHHRALPLMVRAELTATTEQLAGWEITEHVGVVTADVVAAADFFRDFAVEVRDLVGGRSGTLEGVLRRARAECLEELRVAAHRAGAHGLVGVRISTDAPTKSVLIVSAAGSAVTLSRSGSAPEPPEESAPAIDQEDDEEEPPQLEGNEDPAAGPTGEPAGDAVTSQEPPGDGTGLRAGEVD